MNGDSNNSTPSEFDDDFDALRKRVITEVREGRFDSGLALLDDGIARAKAIDDIDVVDRLQLNRSSILIVRLQGDLMLRDVQAILMRSSSPLNRHLAAYNIAEINRYKDRYDRGLFYSRMGLEYADRLDDTLYAARSNNQLGVLLTVQSYFSEAIGHFEEALTLLGESLDDRVTIGYNLAYCHFSLNAPSAGFPFAFDSLRLCRRITTDSSFQHVAARLILCYGYLTIERFDRARHHGEIGLEHARALENPDAYKKALYLLGEVEKQAGDYYSSAAHFAELQREFFADDPSLVNLLMATDTLGLVNLMA
ncbi:MAG: hypothetical protein AAGD38_08605 [Acidobacteriota bacterium]